MTAANLGRLMEPVARHLLGEPNKEFSDTTELRYGSHGSLAIDLKHGRWYDHEAQVGGGVLALVARNIGCGNGEAVEWLREQGFEVPGDTPRRRPFAERIVCTYRYLYADGGHAFDVVRLRDPKEFKQRAPDGTWRVKGIRKVLYRLPEILEAPEGATVFFVEGEKDVDRLFELGLRATTSPEGAGKWRDDYADALRLIRAAVVPDNDTSGAEHAQTVVNRSGAVTCRPPSCACQTSCPRAMSPTGSTPAALATNCSSSPRRRWRRPRSVPTSPRGR